MALRATVEGRVQGVGFREATRRLALSLGLRGWVANADDGSVRLHAEGPDEQLARLSEFLEHGPPAATVLQVASRAVPDEGHEQFAIRGVPAGIFVVQRHRARNLHYDLRLEVDGVLKSWAVPKEPSQDPAVKRLAIAQPDHDLSHAGYESDTVELWDRGGYEQGGRVPWPEAIERGHAVFVLHGERLQGGFVLQRTGGNNWLFFKRREPR